MSDCYDRLSKPENKIHVFPIDAWVGRRKFFKTRNEQAPYMGTLLL